MVAVDGFTAAHTQELIDELAADVAALSIHGIVEKTSAYTLASSDIGKYVIFDIASPTHVVCTVPTNAADPIPIGSKIYVISKGLGTVAIGGGGVTILKDQAGSVPDRYILSTLFKSGINEWYLFSKTLNLPPD